MTTGFFWSPDRDRAGCLPGGTIRRSESPLDAARRELEETSHAEADLTYLFRFCGSSKSHRVFYVNTPRDPSPRPCNKIFRCCWFGPVKIATLSTSVPARGIPSPAALRQTCTT
ncbi:NUDIX domain-containing protein [Paraburkholderia nemoris]|uniref:NUDIX domain-containing protein n=1 Tax=Paraburkholderia nemoris TaxID=2793076 RepID=UPI0038B886CF